MSGERGKGREGEGGIPGETPSGTPMPPETALPEEALPEEALPEEAVSDEALAEQERSMRSWLTVAGKTADRGEEDDAPRLLPAVQRKIRDRSRGKFFGDGWSTSQGHLAHGLVALVMLLIVAMAYVALAPSGFAP